MMPFLLVEYARHGARQAFSDDARVTAHSLGGVNFSVVQYIYECMYAGALYSYNTDRNPIRSEIYFGNGGGGGGRGGIGCREAIYEMETEGISDFGGKNSRLRVQTCAARRCDVHFVGKNSNFVLQREKSIFDLAVWCLCEE